jgi:hypothetical protein
VKVLSTPNEDRTNSVLVEVAVPPTMTTEVDKPLQSADIFVSPDYEESYYQADPEAELSPTALPAVEEEVASSLNMTLEEFDKPEESDDTEILLNDALNFTMTEHGLAYLPEDEIEAVDTSEDFIQQSESSQESISQIESVEVGHTLPEVEPMQKVQLAIHEFVESLKAEIVTPESVEIELASTGEQATLGAEADDTAGAYEVYERLEKVLSELFEKLEVEPTPENIKAFILVLQSHDLEEVLAELPEEIDVEYLSKRLGTSEFFQQVKHALASIQQAATRAYSIGTSVLRVYTISYR